MSPKERWAVAGVVLFFGVSAWFMTTRGMRGIVEAGERATTKSAIYRLRELVVLEDSMRAHPEVDPDGDGVGSALLLEELMGRAPIRGPAPHTRVLFEPPLTQMFETPAGPAAEVNGYLLFLCLPAPSGGWQTRPGQPIDDEAAERRWQAYAWPAKPSSAEVLAIEADESIWIRTSSSGLELSCDALRAPGWTRWKNKPGRPRLPGLRPRDGD